MIVLYRGVGLVVAFFAWFLYRWYNTRNLRQAFMDSLPAFFFIGVWIGLYFIVTNL